MILYLKHPKYSTQKLLDNMNSFSKVAGYKTNLQKSLAFPYTNNKLQKYGSNSIYNCLKKIKYPGVT
jgi:hypothetical protein